MADIIENGDATTPSKGKTGWTEQEKYSLLIQIVKQFAGTAAPKWDQIDLPGRSVKSLQHAWAKIKSEAAEFGGPPALNEDGTPVSGPKKRTPAKRKSKAAEEGADGEADENDTPTKKSKATPKKKVAEAAEGEGEDGETPVKKAKATPKKTATPKKAATPRKSKKADPVVPLPESDDEAGDENHNKTSSVDDQLRAEAGAHDGEEV